MQEFLRLLARWKGVDVAPGSQLRLELAAFPKGGLALLVIAGFVAALALVVWVYRRDAARLGRGRRALLAALRGGAVLLAGLVLLEPALVVVEKRARRAHTLLLLDVSQSMAHRDAYRDPAVQPLAQQWRELGVPDPAAASRLDLAKALLRAGDHALWRRLAERNELHAYVFAAGLEPFPLRPAEGATEPSPDLEAIEAQGRYTNLGGAVRAALERSRDANLAGVVVLSDGRRNTGPRGREVARVLARRKAPHVLVLGVGDPSKTRAITLERIEVPERVFQKEPFRVRAVLRSSGHPPTRVRVRLTRSHGGGPRTQVAARVVELGGGVAQAEVEFDRIVSEEAGTFVYAVEVQPPDDEPFHAPRHRRQARVEVLAEKMRVLLMAGGPSHEYRFLATSLIRDDTVEVACWLQSADPDFPQDGNRSLRELPADEKTIDEFDVLVAMDPDPAKLPPDFCELAARQVLENGAGLLWVCGEKFSLEAMRAAANTRPLADLLPIVPDLQRADREFYGLGRAFPRPWPLVLTPAGETHPVTRLLPARDANERLWSSLPGFRFTFPVERLKPGARALVGLDDPSSRSPSGPAPTLVTQLVGAGRVVFFGADETYRWRSAYENAYHALWVKSLRYLYQGRVNAGNARLRIWVDEEHVELGRSVKVSVEAKDESYRPLSAPSFELLLSSEGSPDQSVHLAPVEGMPGHYEATLRPRAVGFYTLAPARPLGRDVRVAFAVQPAEVEREGPADLTELAALASVPGGELVSGPRELLAAVDRIPSRTTIDVLRTPHAVWDTWVTVLAVLALLALEWILRKRFNLP